MEMNNRAQFATLALSSLPGFNHAACIGDPPGMQSSDSTHSFARRFVANAQRLASLEVSAGFVSLSEILECADLSNSSAYGYGLVPMYDAFGKLKPNDKIPPHPWLQLPPPVIKTGKKRWATADIAAWFHRMGVAASQNLDQQTIAAGTHGEVMP